MIVCAHPNQPWNSTLLTLHALQDCKTLNDIKQIHGRLITTGLIKNASLTSKIILKFCSTNHPPLVHFARHLFFSERTLKDRQTRFDTLLWNVITKSFSHSDDDPKQALVIFSLMLQNGVCIDKYSFSLVLKACSRVRLLKEGMQVQGLLRKLDIGSELYLQNSLICFYARCGCVEVAQQLFDRMPKRDSVSYNLLIDAYVKCGMVNYARNLFDTMPTAKKSLVSWNSMISGYVYSDEGLKIAWELFEGMPKRDLISWNLMIDGNVKCGRMESAYDLFDRMPEKDVVSWATMIDGYAKLGSVRIAENLFDQLHEKDVVICNCMMAGYVHNGLCQEALEFFHRMINVDHIVPDHTTLVIILSAIAQLGQIDKGTAVHNHIKERGLILEGKLGVALIDMYAKCGSINNALSVFESLSQKNVDHWNAIIGGLAVHGLGQLGFELFMDMGRDLVQLDDITFIGVLNACAHAGLVKEGQICFELMRRVYNIEPKLQHYGCMVDILGRAGHIDAAREFIYKMPIEPNDVIWRTLLSHCKNNANFYTVEKVAERLMKLDSLYPGSYVLLSNIFAGHGMWNDVSWIRTIMRQRDLTKIPGCSSIELDGAVHEFQVRDNSHPQVEEVYSILDSISDPKLTCRRKKRRIQDFRAVTTELV